MTTQKLISYWNLHRMPILLILLSGVFYGVYGYSLEREDTVRLFTLYGALFFLCFKIIQLEKFNFRFLLGAGIFFRLILLFSLPVLSNDFYRFLWDGYLVEGGLNPYLYKPSDILDKIPISPEYARQLYDGMGSLSQKHFSNYPPLNQLIFSLAVMLGGKSLAGGVLAMRVLIILADVAIVFLGRVLLKRMNRSPHAIFWYFLNPLVVIELCGNLHFEGVMLAFFLAALIFLQQGKWITASPFYAASISLKLVPLLSLPLLIPYLGWRRGIGMGLLTTLLSAATFLPFTAGAVGGNYLETLSLWFSNFEFNAGLYNLVKLIAVSAGAKPWILIGTYGKIVLVLMITFISILTIWRRQVTFGRYVGTLLLTYTVFYLIGATVHPWYVILPLLLGLFTDYRYPVAWSLLVILSYSAYANPGFEEELWILAIEYFLIFGAISYELLKPGRK